MDNKVEILRNSPVFPKIVYENLPEILQKITNEFNTDREKDVILLSSIIMLSGCFTGLKGMYGKDWVFPNLYSFIVAPAASGKSIMKYTKGLGKTIHDDFMKTHKASKNNYNLQFKEWQKSYRENPEEALEAPTELKLPILFIPGNNSASSIYNRIIQSDGKGIIFETEGTTLTGAMRQDWGGFSDIFRKAFHHEALSISRVKDDILQYVEEPKLSIMLSGTPDQVPQLISSAEDGLMSRFLYYCYSVESQWKSPKPGIEDVDLTKYFNNLSIKIAVVKTALEEQQYTFRLTDIQFDSLDDFFNKKVNLIKKYDNQDATAVIFRLGLITYRMAMVLTVLSNMDDLREDRLLTCNDKDFKVALNLIDTLLDHSMIMLELMPKVKTGLAFSVVKFYNALPINESFTRKQADEIGRALSLSSRTVQNYLVKLHEVKYVESVKYGVFKTQQE